MDPVAAQFLHQLDAATDELPKAVVAGLQMCGDDVSDELMARVADRERPLATRCFSAYALTQMHLDEAYPVLVDAFLEGDSNLMGVLTPLLIEGRAAAGRALLARATDTTLIPQARAVLGGLAARAGAPASEVEQVAIDVFPTAPREALQLMQLQPSSRYAEVLRAHPEALRAAPELGMQVLLQSTSDGTPEERAAVASLAGALGGFMDDTLQAASAEFSPEDER